MADASDEESLLLQTFLDDFSIKLWKDCCRAAKECCQKMASEECKNSLPYIKLDKTMWRIYFLDSTGKTDGRCPSTWDGWQCWPKGGSPGQVEYSPCPNYIYFHSVDQYSCGSM